MRPSFCACIRTHVRLGSRNAALLRRRRPSRRADRGSARPGPGRGRRPGALRAPARARGPRALAARGRRRAATPGSRGAARNVGLAAASRRRARRSRRRRSSSSTSRRPVSRPARRRSARSAQSACARSSSRSGSRRSSTRAGRCRRRSRRSRGSIRARCAAHRRSSSRCAASSSSPATRCSSRTTRASTSAFLDREVERLTGRRVAAPVVDTVWLARRLLAGRLEARRARLARALLRHGGAAVSPRARGRRGDRGDPARADRARAGARDARPSPSSSTCLRRGRAGSRASARSSRARRRSPASTSSATGTTRCSTSAARATCRARLRSYFRTDRQRPAVEAALGALARVEWRVLGSELEAGARGAAAAARAAPARERAQRAARPLRLSPPARQPAGASPTRPARYGPLKSRARARAAARALDGWDGEPAAALPALRTKLKRLSRRPPLRGRRPSARPHRRARGGRRQRSRSSIVSARSSSACSCPRAEQGFRRAFFVSGGRVVAARTLLPGAAGRVEAEAGLAAAARAEPSLAPRRRGRAAPDRLVPAPAAARAARRAARGSPPRRVALRPWRLGGHRDVRRPAREAVERKRSQLVVGLDPRLDLLPVELRGEAVLGRAEAADAYARFCCGIVDAVAPYVVAVKPQTAFFEALGADGFAALERVCRYARSAGLLVIADGKRGDIGSTARAYAAAYPRAARRRSRRSPTR